MDLKASVARGGWLATAGAMLAVATVQAAPAALRQVDDSYTPSQRYDAYHAQHPELALPEVRFEAGQRVLFDRRYRRIGARELHVDVFLPPPARANHAGLLLVHGGGWRAGNKSNFYPMASLLAQRGYVVFLPEFRLSPEAPYPAGLVDLNDAMAWAKAEAAGFEVDPDRIAIGGESSGGQMAALLAYTARTRLYKSRPGAETGASALIDIDGVLDLTSPLALRYENAAGDASPAALWLGGSMERVPARWREASAALHADGRSPPTLVITSAEPRFTAGVEATCTELHARGTRCEVAPFPGTPHAFWLFDPYVEQVAERIDAFLRPSP